MSIKMDELDAKNNLPEDGAGAAINSPDEDDLDDPQVGMQVTAIVGNSVKVLSVNGSRSHKAQLDAGLKAAGINNMEAESPGYTEQFAMANARGYTAPSARAIQPTLSQDFSPGA